MSPSQKISSDFPYESNHIEVHGSSIHYVEEGAGEPLLFLHGNPTSSYLWRNIIPHLTPMGQCIAMDLIGMGKSDKPDIEYRFLDHVKYVESFIEKMGLRNITLVIHDWGSALGFYYAMRHENNIKGLAFMEAIIMPIPSWEMFPADMREIFKNFRTPETGWDMIVNNNFFIEQILFDKGIVRRLTEEEKIHYRQPFIDPTSRTPIWRWPNEIPIEGAPLEVVEVVEAYNRWLQKTELPKLLFYGNPGALITAPTMEWCKQNLMNLKTVDIGRGNHYLQEDNPHLIGSELAGWFKSL